MADLPAKLKRAAIVRASDIPPELLTRIWGRFVEALAPLRAVGKLGYVLVQLPPWFQPTRDAYGYLERLPERLRNLPIALELRSADWFTHERSVQTLSRLRALGLSDVAGPAEAVVVCGGGGLAIAAVSVDAPEPAAVRQGPYRLASARCASARRGVRVRAGVRQCVRARPAAIGPGRTARE